ncbi:MAG TPA: amidohydrolase [Selenomonadales bacterium]|nr:amidohydrolase [Selenomonadales bacterium]
MLALRGATIHTMTGGRPVEGTVIIEGGRIKAVERRVELPAAAEVIDVEGKVITPGIIDAHTHLGVYTEGTAWAGEDINERTEPVTPEMNVIDGLNPADIGLEEAWLGGVTTVMVAPGSANPIGGQCVVIKTPRKARIEEMIIRQNAGLKIAFGENPKRCYGAENKKMPATRMATAALIRKAFAQAAEYLKNQGGKDFKPDFGLEALAKVLRREMPLRAHAHRADDIMTALRIARELDVDIIVEHATEGYQVADILAREQVPVILGPTMTTRSKLELKDKNMASPAIMEQQGVLFAMMSDHPVIPSCFLPVYAGLATRYGLNEERALRMITADAARILGVDGRLGTLAAGLDADLVVWSGHPFRLASRPELVIVDGQVTKP